MRWGVLVVLAWALGGCLGLSEGIEADGCATGGRSYPGPIETEMTSAAKKATVEKDVGTTGFTGEDIFVGPPPNSEDWIIWGPGPTGFVGDDAAAIVQPDQVVKVSR